jgi:DNA-directed RNA polymerase
MLVRAAHRKARPEAIRHRISCEQLYLPWLCPAYNAPFRECRRQISVNAGSHTSALRKRRNSQDGSNMASRRALATALNYRPLDDIPFEGLNIPPPSSPQRVTTSHDANSLSNLRPFDSLSPVLLGGSLETAPQRYRVGRAGIGGDLSEILSLFDACLQVGRMERAGVILKRIAKLGAVESEQLLALHNQYLRVAVEQIIMKPSESATQDLHKWFELEIRHQGLLQNAETIAYMLKAALQSPQGKPGGRRDRLVRRYMDMVPGEDGLEVLGLGILTAQELNQINHICPTYNLAEAFESHFGEELEIPESSNCELLEQSQPGLDHPVPHVRPTGQKGLGLKSLKKSLSLFSKLPTSGIDMASLSIEEKRQIQAKLEEDAVNSSIDRWREESVHLSKMGLNTALQTKSLGARMWRWHMAVEQRLKEELVKVDEAELKEKKNIEDQERCLYGPFLRTLPADKLAAVSIISIMTTMSSLGVDKGLPLSKAIMAIAENVEDESVFEAIQSNGKKGIWPNSFKGDRKGGMDPALIRRAIRFRGADSAAKLVSPNPGDESNMEGRHRQWPMTMKAKVGAFLMSALIDMAKVPVTLEHPDTKEVVTQMQPAFSHSHQYKMGKKVGVVIANNVLVQQLKREPVHSLLAKHLPMLVEPDPWTEFNKGGFISHPAKMMRIKLGDKDQRHYAEAAIGKGDMEQTFKGLDVLGKTGWRINQPVFDVMLEAWNSGEAIANIAPENPKLQIPPEPEATKDPLERRRWIRTLKLIENARTGMHSQRCFQNFQLEIARALRKEVFYFPHNVDFRGRAYPIPPYLNHMGADHCRGLLTFAKGKELGENGLRWLKIHLANVYGFDKASLEEREAFATKHMNSIYESATNPLNGSRWWLTAEDPWQCLAACIELKNALESSDATRFVSHLAIHQDGTCNGLQHYAALGGDVWGAKQVNLEPGNRPADVYSAVANLVRESISNDNERGNPFAKLLDGKITRKIVKQTVMTNVYGVTFVGAKAQVRKQLVAAYPDLPNEDTMNPGLLASYIAVKIFTALSSMFRGAHDIQYWLGECASRITQSLTPEQLDRLQMDWPHFMAKAKSPAKDGWTPPRIEELTQFKSSVIWTNPLHMPVVQPYRLSKSRVVMTNMQRISLSEPHRSNPVSKRKQLQGFPPNFIHSLDATHMLLSALKCDELGLSFAAVHDSFWTHAADIDAMNEVLRDTFIRIHSDDVIGRLAAEFSARYKDCMYLARVKAGTPLHKRIKALRESEGRQKWGKAIKSKSKRLARLDELLTECKRLRLLRSSDPEEVKEGQSMVTPGSIFEEMAAVTDLAPEEDVADLALGDISSREAKLHMEQEIEVEDLQSNVEEVNSPFAGGARLDSAIGGDEHGSSQADKHVDVDNSDSEEDLRGTFEKKLGHKTRIQDTYSFVWLPLTFPPVPKKVKHISLLRIYKCLLFAREILRSHDLKKVNISSHEGVASEHCNKRQFRGLFQGSRHQVPAVGRFGKAGS